MPNDWNKVGRWRVLSLYPSFTFEGMQPVKVFFTLAVALATVFSAGAATATSYSGNWPFTVTDSKGFNGKHCLAVTDDGSFGWPHSGFGKLDGNFATFQVIGTHIEVVAQDEGQEVEGTVVTASAKNGSIGKGVFTIVLAGESEHSGRVAFAEKGGC
ncbi:MAG TPA: hypothetical protein VHY79_10825 [Rhizomicrobium sp.]|jgi:hypothetical protein|nr:hypothetical protein [Rhizomicrobium sp.]